MQIILLPLITSCMKAWLLSFSFLLLYTYSLARYAWHIVDINKYLIKIKKIEKGWNILVYLYPSVKNRSRLPIFNNQSITEYTSLKLYPVS